MIWNENPVFLSMHVNLTPIWHLSIYYAPLSRPEGPRRCSDKDNTGGALVFSGKFCTVHSVPTVNYVPIVNAVTTMTKSNKVTTTSIVG